ncbi:MAG: TIGR03960 family B12-binding radical SAM protein [Bacillota bacterium]|jgi:radical SAM family uncharacterized protein
MRPYIEQNLLPHVTRPSQYVGDEWNSVKKDWAECAAKLAFLFPDVYEIGMSHLGLRILYHIVNNRKEYLMERAFAPMVDMEELMRKNKIPLFSLESYRPVKDFDILGFTLQYEMSYTNIINMLDLAGIPIKSQDRKGDYPLVMAGGPCAFNPEPLADFIDFFVLGEGEEVVLEILELVRISKNKGPSFNKSQFLKNVAQIKGVYVPEFYHVTYHSSGIISQIAPVGQDVPPVVFKRVVRNFSDVEFPEETIVPHTQTVHDRVMLEVLRGCSRGCRFCQAGMIYRPVREKQMDKLLLQADKLVGATGYDEIALTSLSTADYTCVESLIKELIKRHGDQRVGVSLPSLRVDTFCLNLAQEVQQVRKSGLTFAPEAGTQRLRDVINKGVTEENIIDTMSAAFAQGWTSLKLYFMIGLPTETYHDLDGILELVQKIIRVGKNNKPREIKRPIKINVSVSSFVPKAQTPFQWEGQEPREILWEKQIYLKEKIKKMRNVTFSFHEVEVSFLEAAFARGNRKLGKVLEEAWKLGCKFDSWTEHFKFEKWLNAFENCGLEASYFANRKFEFEEILPWDHISSGVSKEWLKKECLLAFHEKRTEDCRIVPCSGCGVCPQLDVKPEVMEKM